MRPLTLSDYATIVKSFKNGKASGLDKLSIEMLKGSETLYHEVLHIVREVYLTNEVPTEWQQTYTVPIAKTKKIPIPSTTIAN
jgi:hypothetical protein